MRASESLPGRHGAAARVGDGDGAAAAVDGGALVAPLLVLEPPHAASVDATRTAASGSTNTSNFADLSVT